MLKPAKKRSRKAIVKELDKVFSQFIRQRDGRCVQCGKTDGLTCGHLFSRVNFSTRWDEENCWCQCFGCNLRHEHEFEPFRRVVEGKIGLSRYDSLWFRHNQMRRYKDFELTDLIKYYKDKLCNQ